MAKSQNKKSGGARKIGREQRKPAHQKYVAHDVCTKNKKKRILQSNGEAFLKAWLLKRYHRD